jgi:hypothetical protein
MDGECGDNSRTILKILVAAALLGICRTAAPALGTGIAALMDKRGHY